MREIYDTSTSYICLHGEGTGASGLSSRKLSNKGISMMKCNKKKKKKKKKNHI